MRAVVPRPRSIRVLLAALVLVAALPFAALIVYDYTTQRDARLDFAGESALKLASAAAAALAHMIDDDRAMLAAVAARPAQRSPHSVPCDPIVDDLRALHPRRANLAIVAASGEVLCAARMPADGKPLMMPRVAHIVRRRRSRRRSRTALDWLMARSGWCARARSTCDR